MGGGGGFRFRSEGHHVCEPILVSEHRHSAKGSGFEANWQEGNAWAGEEERDVSKDRGVDESVERLLDLESGGSAISLLRVTKVNIAYLPSPTSRLWQLE